MDFNFECGQGGGKPNPCHDDFRVKLSNPTGASIADGSGIGKIFDDDGD